MFEGNGYTISNLYTRGAGEVGLFGSTDADAEIRNVGLIDNNSYGEGGIDGLVGWNNSGTITASYATGDQMETSAGWLASIAARLSRATLLETPMAELETTLSAGWLAGISLARLSRATLLEAPMAEMESTMSAGWLA